MSSTLAVKESVQKCYTVGDIKHPCPYETMTVQEMKRVCEERNLVLNNSACTSEAYLHYRLRESQDTAETKIKLQSAKQQQEILEQYLNWFAVETTHELKVNLRNQTDQEDYDTYVYLNQTALNPMMYQVFEVDTEEMEDVLNNDMCWTDRYLFANSDQLGHA